MIGTQTNADLDAQVLSIDARQGERLIEDVCTFLGRFVAYPSEQARVAHALWIFHAHLMEQWESTPRIAFLSAEPASGKTRALEVTGLLVPNPIVTVNVSPAYLFRKVGSEEGATILFDEIDTIFGPKAKDNEDIRGLLNAGHRRGATTGRCVVRGATVFTEELPAYAAVALAGLGWLPDTLLTRSIIIRMRRRHSGERVEPFRPRLHESQGWYLREAIAAWAASMRSEIRWPSLPPQITDRDADVWEPLIAVADAAGGEWPRRARVTAVTLVTQARDVEPSLGIKLLTDMKIVFGEAEALSSKSVLADLHATAESPWGDMRGKPLDERGLAQRLRQYGIKSKTIRVGTILFKGYSRSDFVDVWDRYVPAPPGTSVTSVTCVTDRVHGLDDVTDVTHVTHVGGGGRVCAHCRGRDGVFCEASIAGEPVTLHVHCKNSYLA
jgi:hypothetical protein